MAESSDRAGTSGKACDPAAITPAEITRIEFSRIEDP
jgi:hypothetical protein